MNASRRYFQSPICDLFEVAGQNDVLSLLQLNYYNALKYLSAL